MASASEFILSSASEVNTPSQTAMPLWLKSPKTRRRRGGCLEARKHGLRPVAREHALRAVARELESTGYALWLESTRFALYPFRLNA